MNGDANFAVAASLMGDPARAAMLAALLDGRAQAANELAYTGRVTPQTASSHLARLVDGGLLTTETQGRHRYFRLAGPHVAEAIERLCAIRPVERPRRKTLTRQAKALQGARRCYNHLAGRLGVTVTDALVRAGHLVPAPEKRFTLTDSGRRWFDDIGADLPALKPARRGLAQQCLDWTERTHHLAGPLGVELLRCFCDRGWLRGTRESRALDVTPRGRRELECRLGFDPCHDW